MSNEQEMKVPLSERLRPDVECAPWVIEEVRKLEAATLAAEARIRELEADANRWEKVETLMTLGNVQLNQDEDGGFSVYLEPVDNLLVPTWTGNNPTEAIDAALPEHKENQEDFARIDDDDLEAWHNDRDCR